MKSHEFPFQPNFYRYFPVLTPMQLDQRLKYLPANRATLLTAPNLYTLGNSDSPDIASIKALLTSPRMQRKAWLCEVLETVGICAPIAKIVSMEERDEFVLDQLKPLAWANITLPFESHAWVTMPGLVALMLEQLRETCPKSICEMGAGSGLHLAALRGIFPSARLLGVELRKPYAEFGREVLKRTGRSDIQIEVGSEFKDYNDVDLMVFTFSASSTYWQHVLESRQNRYTQLPRLLSPCEFEAARGAHPKLRLFSAYSEYAANPATFCLSLHYGLREINSLYNVRFVPSPLAAFGGRLDTPSRELGWLRSRSGDWA